MLLLVLVLSIQDQTTGNLQQPSEGVGPLVQQVRLLPAGRPHLDPLLLRLLPRATYACRPSLRGCPQQHQDRPDSREDHRGNIRL